MQRLVLPFLAVVLCGCVTRDDRPEGLPPEPVTRSTVPYYIAPLDGAHLAFRDGRRMVVEVSIDGDIVLPGGPRYVKGMESGEFLGLVRRAWPGVSTVRLEEFRPNRVTVLGEVFHQIHTDLGDGPMRVMDAIAAANGFTPIANKRRVRLLRQNAGDIEVYELDLREMLKGRDLAQNMLLRAGDVITVPRNFL